jgi:hypothetical protein
MRTSCSGVHMCMAPVLATITDMHTRHPRFASVVKSSKHLIVFKTYRCGFLLLLRDTEQQRDPDQ